MTGTSNARKAGAVVNLYTLTPEAQTQAGEGFLGKVLGLGVGAAADAAAPTPNPKTLPKKPSPA